MSDPDFQPKAFYRKLDSLLIRIGDGQGTGEIASLVLEELVSSIGDELKIAGGGLYKLKLGSYELVKGPIGDQKSAWPASLPREDESIALLRRHKSYIFTGDTADSPWGSDSVAVLVGESNQYLYVFKLASGWIRESLEFSLNTIRSLLNYSRVTSRFAADIEEAYQIQKSLLPEEDPHFEGYDIAARFLAAEIVGGDLYDYHFLDEDVLGIAIGDASGHGLPAALVARDVVTGLRMGVEKEMKISGVIGRLNRVINLSSLSTRFVSLIYGELERNGTFVYINAGHPPPMLFKGDRIQELPAGGTILGPIAHSVYQRGFAFLDPGDLLFFFSDGILEASDRSGEMIDKAVLKDYLRNNREKPARVIVDGLFDYLLDLGMCERLRDDATAIIVKRDHETA